MLKKITFLSKKYHISQSEEELTPETALTPVTPQTPKDFQTDDSDTGTPSKIKVQQIRFSKFKPHHQTTRSQYLNNARNLIIKRDKLQDHPYRQLIFGKRVKEENFIKHLKQTQRGVLYSTKSLKSPSDKFLQQRKVDIPLKDKQKKILILDLDETLVHSCTSQEKCQVTLNTNDGSIIRFNVRPHLAYFLDSLSTFYQIFVFTASSASYATTIIDYIDPLQDKILGIFTRNHCLETKNGFFIKDLRILKDIDLKNVAIVDNLVHSFGFQLDNGIPILEWCDDDRDSELKYLVDYLIEASQQQDLRIFNKEKLKLHDLINFNIDYFAQ